MMSQSPLPTRVSRACDRCRRNKSRCDSFRPCSLCLRANAHCSNNSTIYQSDAHEGERAPLPSSQREPTYSSSRPVKRQKTTSGPSTEPLHVQGLHRANLSSPSHETGTEVSNAEVQHAGGNSIISIARTISGLQKESAHGYSVHAIPGANDDLSLPSPDNAAPTASYLMFPLPSAADMDALLQEYFESIHWFSLVVMTSKFSAAYKTVRAGNLNPSDLPFLLLLSTMLGLAAKYRAQRLSDPAEWSRTMEMSRKLILNAESQIMNILDQRSVTAVQTLILLGSFYVYYGRPNLSFSLLGSTIKAAQSMGMHRSCSQTNYLDREERKRVWWTIYTWDRFSSVNYGQPFGISDKVCNVEQPDDVFETVILGNEMSTDQQQTICYSPYQRELNKLYLIASPAIERVYRTDGDPRRRSMEEYHVLVSEVTAKIWQWRRDLPPHLHLDIDEDWPISMSPGDKAHRLQSLSLYLTFDSLIVVLHRPFMKQYLDSIISSPLTQQSPSIETPSNETSTHEQLWSAAVRTTKITELPQLAQHATEGHLSNFLTMNMFNAAVVLIVKAISDPLTDHAQQAKRAVARVHRLLGALATQSTLSQQSAAVLRSLIQLLISRESDAILAPTNVPVSRTTHVEDGNNTTSTMLTVREALRVPLHTDREINVVRTERAGLDSSARLEPGLSSVQRAFAEIPNEVFASRDPSRRQSQDLGSTEEQGAPAHSTQRPANADLSAGIEWHSLESSTDIGLHWIWDPAWDNLFSEAGI